MKKHMNKLFLVVALLGIIALVLPITGCSHLYSSKIVESDPEARNNETWGYLNQAMRLLDKYPNINFEATGYEIPLNIKWTYVPGTMVKGKAAVKNPDTGKWNGGYTWQGETVVAMYPDGSLGPITGVHEAAHNLLFGCGFGVGQHHKIMKACGVPGA